MKRFHGPPLEPDLEGQPNDTGEARHHAGVKEHLRRQPKSREDGMDAAGHRPRMCQGEAGLCVMSHHVSPPARALRDPGESI